MTASRIVGVLPLFSDVVFISLLSLMMSVFCFLVFWFGVIGIVCGAASAAPMGQSMVKLPSLLDAYGLWVRKPRCAGTIAARLAFGFVDGLFGDILCSVHELPGGILGFLDAFFGGLFDMTHSLIPPAFGTQFRVVGQYSRRFLDAPLRHFC
jgi:hypothetical protein